MEHCLKLMIGNRNTNGPPDMDPLTRCYEDFSAKDENLWSGQGAGVAPSRTTSACVGTAAIEATSVVQLCGPMVADGNTELGEFDSLFGGGLDAMHEDWGDSDQSMSSDEEVGLAPIQHGGVGRCCSEPPRRQSSVCRVARRWGLSVSDAAGILQDFEDAQSSQPAATSPGSSNVSRFGELIL
jgi:hypothetical protein